MTTVARQYGLKSELSPGMFSNERLAAVRDHEGRERVLFVPDFKISGDAILVRLIEEVGDIALVRLPGELLVAGWTLSVRRSQLEPA